MMTVTDYHVGSSNITLDNAPAKEVTVPSVISQLRAMTALCNAAEFDAADMNTPTERRRVHGDATDQAILRFSERLGSVREVRQGWKKTFELAFNSKNKFMVRTFEAAGKAAVEITLPEGEHQAFEDNT